MAHAERSHVGQWHSVSSLSFLQPLTVCCVKTAYVLCFTL
jgi:hypothetical protein